MVVQLLEFRIDSFEVERGKSIELGKPVILLRAVSIIEGMRGWTTYQFLLFAVQVRESGAQLLQST